METKKHQRKPNTGRLKLKFEQQKTGTVIRPSGGVSSSCTTSGTRRVFFVTNLVLGRGRGKKDFDKRKIYVVICETDIL